jgi:hypothetical protein
MKVDKMQASRFELKYKLDEDTALRVRDFVRCYLEVDENGVGKPDFSYPVHSVYLDSDELKTYWDTINGDKNRFKLRIRFYDNNPANPVFFEIKRRMNNCIMKQRGCVRREAVKSLLAGHFPGPEHMASDNPKHLHAVQNFCRMIENIRGKPKVHVAYLREAYVPIDDNSARLTMDRLVRVEPDLEPRLQTAMSAPVHLWGNTVVLELKFTNRFPRWFGELVRFFNLKQCGAAKYAEGIALMNEQVPGCEQVLRGLCEYHGPAASFREQNRFNSRAWQLG